MRNERKNGVVIVMARNPDNDVAKQFIDAMHIVIIDSMKHFIQIHWDEDEDVWYEGCDISETFDWIDLHFTPIKELARFYHTLCVIPEERINFMFSGDIEDLDVEYYKKEFDKLFEEKEGSD